VGYYRSGKPEKLIRELSRVVKRGGFIAIMAYSSQQLLPGYPFLEAILNATSAGIAPTLRQDNPKHHFHRALGWFHEAGLQNLKAQTFVGEVQAPLTRDRIEALLSLFDMRWGQAKSEMSEKDWDLYQDLIDQKSPRFILDVTGYYAFFTYTLFRGFVP
jgi:demethylmenaquinone methyltransferase/2-methoxy-6-polyprenyl-1,4-benzoquinol methylase